VAKTVAKSCPLCLSVNDPDDMLPVTMPHSTPPQSAPMYLCRRCVLEVIKSAIASDLIDPSEVFPHAPSGDNPDRGGGDAPDPAAAAAPLVSGDQPGADGSALDRPEPQVPAGGKAKCRDCQQEFDADELADWAPPGGQTVKLCSSCMTDAELEL
jgi:hypothetical protein